MGKVIISNRTTKDPITLIGECAGECWGANTTDTTKNYKRGLDCLESGHGRTFEFPDVYFKLEGYSAKVIREFYTHIGGAPTRLQASTRYINYKNFDYIIPHSIYNSSEEALKRYIDHMIYTSKTIQILKDAGVPNEDATMVLPLSMATTMVGKFNLRTLMDMSRMRECTRAYWEFRELFRDLKKALSEYSEEWKYLTDNFFMPKCEATGFCTEKNTCGRKPKKENLKK